MSTSVGVMVDTIESTTETMDPWVIAFRRMTPFASTYLTPASSGSFTTTL